MPFQLICLLQAIVLATVFAYKEPEPKLLVEDYPQQMVRTFLPDNLTGENLRILAIEGDYVLIGGRNTLHNVSSVTMEQVSNISWVTTANPNCEERRIGDDACGNFIRVARRMSSDVLLVCGTHGGSPRCRVYKHSTGGAFVWKTDIDGKTVCPANKNQTAVYLTTGPKFIAAVSADVQTGRLPILYSNPLLSASSSQLNWDAEFAGAVAWNDFAYVFYRETAAESVQCGKHVVATVARVCKEDPGAPVPFQQYWSTFVKARLQCSLNGSVPFNFTHIRGVSSPELFRSSMARNLVYAFFSTPGNPIQMSAVCVFDLAGLNRALRGNKSEQEDTCVFQNRSPEAFNVEANPLGEAVHQMREPLLIHVGVNYHYTAMAVDNQVQTASGRRFDVLFVGTSHGHVIKAINTGTTAVSTVIIEDIIVFPEREPVQELKIIRNPKTITLLVTTYHEVVSVPLDNCNWTARTCSQCVGLQDPYCAWDRARGWCESIVGGPIAMGLIQNVSSGQSGLCPEGKPRPTDRSRIVHGREPANSDPEPLQVSHFYSGQTLGLAVSFCTVGSVIIGVFTGYWCSGHRKKSLFYFHYK